MPPILALLVCFLFIVWLFMKERRSRGSVSSALWIPVAWALIIGSKPISEWLGWDSGRAAGTVASLEGSPLDRAIFFFLIAAGLYVLAQRSGCWMDIISENKWLFAFSFYLLISVLWSDYPFVSLKRWIKDFGNIVMVLVILSDPNPREAIKSVLLRCTYVLVPLSVVLIKYFPDIGRAYDRWNYGVFYRGVAGDKNLLGMTLFVCGLFLFDVLLESRERVSDLRPTDFQIPPILLLLMTLWLLVKSHSATALVSTVVCSACLFVLKRSGAKRLVIYALIIAVVGGFLLSTLNIGALLGGVLGRDTTLTGRTEIWKMLLGEKINPLFGTGFYSFWLGDRIQKMSQRFYYSLNEAHNGYLESYLNSGLIGVFLLLILMAASLRSRWRDLKAGVPGSAFAVAFLVGTVMYNISEATFNRLSIVWFTFLLVIVTYPRPQEEPEAGTSWKFGARGRTFKGVPAGQPERV